SSSFGISKISKNLSNPNRFIGCHFFMPADIVPLVEIIMGSRTTDHVFKLVKNMMISIGCVPIRVNKEVPGFIGNRLQHAMLREAFSLIEKKIIEPEDIDKAVKYGFGLRYISNGPILQKEISGLDVHYLAAKEIYKSLNNDKTPSKILYAKIKQGHFGIKTNILRLLSDHVGIVKVVNAKASFDEVMSYKPKGIFLSNGPGDPEPCTYAIENIKKFLEIKIPIFGICLGHQLLALAGGARTYKMKFGHHGANHPVQDIKTKEVFITSQNHGFAVDEESLPKNITSSHISLFDKSLQGIEFNDTPAFSFQGHPEASPGPQEIQKLFNKFKLMVEDYAKT
ncbi:MAG: hypothetical protein EBX23_00475, partial [Proteobacteria bacterium]|nr:hypothetical protein [Pseudomonadota bacterium]